MRKPMPLHGRSPYPCLILVGGFLQHSKSPRFSLPDLMMISWYPYPSGRVPASAVGYSNCGKCRLGFPSQVFTQSIESKIIVCFCSGRW